MHPHLGKRLQTGTEPLAALTRRPGKPLASSVIRSKKGNDAISFAVIYMSEDNGV